MSIVARVRSLSSRINSIFLSLSSRSGFKRDRSVGDRLKNAISEPLARAETTKRKQVRIIVMTTPKVGAVITTSEKALYKGDKSKS